MAILVLKEEKQKYLIFLFIGLVFLTFLVIWFGIFKRRPVVLVIPPPQPKKIEINFPVLESQTLKEFEIFEEISWLEEKGRENPFLPY